MSYPDTTPVQFPYDPLAGADWTRDQLKDASSCPKCGSPDPAILYRQGEHGEDLCSDCTPEPHCSACLRIFASFPGLSYVLVDWAPTDHGCNCGRVHERRVCTDCWSRVK